MRKNRINRHLKIKTQRIGSMPVVALILLTLPGWILAWSSNLSYAADVAALWGAALMFKGIWTFIGYPTEMMRFLRLGAIVLCALQNVSWLTASLIHRFVLNIPIGRTLRQIGGVEFSLSAYALAYIFITLFAAMIAYLGSSNWMYKKERRVTYLLTGLKTIPILKLRNILAVLLVAEFYLIASGVIGQRSIVVKDTAEGERTFSVTLFSIILPSQILFNAVFLYLLLIKRNFPKFKFSWMILVVSLSTVLFLYFNKGRSGLFFSILAFGYWLAFFYQTRPKIWKFALVCSIIYPILSQVLLFSNFIRSTNAGIENWKGSAIEVVPKAWERFQSSSNLVEQEKNRTANNLSTRPLVATPLAMSINLPVERKSFMLGENIINSLIWVIPGPLFPNKRDYPIQEALLYKHFPIGEVDTADSLYLSAYTEFGWIGILFYPLFLFSLWVLVVNFVFSIRQLPLIGAICIAYFFQLFLLNIGEGAVSNWLIGFRSVLFLFIIGKIWLLFFAPRKQSQHLPAIEFN